MIALLLSRGAGAGWLVVVAAIFLGGTVLAGLSSLAGIVGLRLALSVPSDAFAGEQVTIAVQLSSWLPQLRTLKLLAFDGSTHPVARTGTATCRVEVGRRGVVPDVLVEIRAGALLGLVRTARRVRVVLPTPLAIAPVPDTVSLADALGEDPAAETRTIRAYITGDAARMVHWRSTARRGELMVRELESAMTPRGRALEIRVTLSEDLDQADAAASRAAGLAIAALDAGFTVRVLTREADGQHSAEVRTRRDVGRRLAAAVPGEPAAADGAARSIQVGP